MYYCLISLYESVFILSVVILLINLMIHFIIRLKDKFQERNNLCFLYMWNPCFATSAPNDSSIVIPRSPKKTFTCYDVISGHFPNYRSLQMLFKFWLIFQFLLRDTEKDVGLPQLKFNENYICTLVFNQKIDVNIMYRKEKNQDELQKKMMIENVFGLATGGCAFGIEDNR